MNNRQLTKRNTILKNQSPAIVIFFSLLLVSILVVNFMTFRSYQEMGMETVVPLDSLVFLLTGTAFLGIAAFSFLQLYQYKTGRLFAFYVLLLGISVALAPCNRLNEPVITMIRIICTCVSSLMLFNVIGYLTLLINKKMFRVLQFILVCVTIVGIVRQDEGVNGSIILSALFCLIIMGINYRKSNTYTKKQSKMLLLGIGVGTILFFAASFMPNVYLIQQEPGETEAFVELVLLPTETVMDSVPLLIFAGVSVAIIFMLLQREFVLKNMRLKLKFFIIIPLCFLVLNVLIFTYTNCPIWLMVVINGMFLLPFTFSMEGLTGLGKTTEEQTYQWRLSEEIEKEKQELSSYLHDEVLQSLIAFYRQVQADETGRYEDMKSSLSGLIAEMRNVSHNLYPTMVEDLGLEQSLYIFADELQKSYPEIKIHFEYEFAEGILPKTLALTFYRITKELVTNAAKHSGGSEVNFLLKEDGSGYYIQVQDNGKGFLLPKNDDLLKSPHMGIYTVKKRVAELQGQISFTSNPNVGTEYQIYFSKKGEAASDT